MPAIQEFLSNWPGHGCVDNKSGVMRFDWKKCFAAAGITDAEDIVAYYSRLFVQVLFTSLSSGVTLKLQAFSQGAEQPQDKAEAVLLS